MSFIFLFLGCNKNQNHEYHIIIGDDPFIIPEGIVVNSRTDDIFVSSIHKKKIIHFDNVAASDFIESGMNGYMNGIGMEYDAKTNLLYAISGDLMTHQISSVHVFDATTAREINSYTFRSDTTLLWNDLVVYHDSLLLITDTYGHAVYSVNTGSGKTEKFIHGDEILFPNGIDISANQDFLYVASTPFGIRIYDLTRKAFVNQKDTSWFSRGIDGLKYYRNNLFGIQNATRDTSRIRVTRYFLNARGDSIEGSETIVQHHPLFDIPTTLDVADDNLYILANSHLRKLNQQENTIKDTTGTHAPVVIIMPLVFRETTIKN